MNDPAPTDSPSASPKQPKGHTPARWFRATSASSIGIEIAIAVCVPTLIGRWADGKWSDIAPFGIVFGLIVGCGGAARAVQRALGDYKRELKNPNDAEESLFVPGSLGSMLHEVGKGNAKKKSDGEGNDAHKG